MLVGKSFVYILFICLALYIIVNNDDKDTTSLEETESKTVMQILDSHLHVSSCNMIKALYKKFFLSYTTLLMERYTEAEYNLMMQHRASLLRLVNEVDNVKLLGEDLVEQISNDILLNTSRYIDVIHEKYKLRSRKSFPVEFNSYQKYDEYF
jgi:hypothetical protein